MQFERKLNRIGDSTYTVSIPSDLAKFMGLTNDTILIIEEKDNIVTIRKKE